MCNIYLIYFYSILRSSNFFLSLTYICIVFNYISFACNCPFQNRKNNFQKIFHSRRIIFLYNQYNEINETFLLVIFSTLHFIWIMQKSISYSNNINIILFPAYCSINITSIQFLKHIVYAYNLQIYKMENAIFSKLLLR